MGPGAIQVSATQDGDRVRLSVLDDGLGVPAGDVVEGIGLRTTRERLRQLYGDDQTFTLSRAPQGGTSCTLSLPLRRCTRAAGANGAEGHR